MIPSTNIQNKALSDLYNHIEHALSTAPKLHNVTVPKHFAKMPGTLHGADVEMHIQRYRNNDYESITLARLYDKQGSIKTVTLIGLPYAGSQLPIIGLDAVAMGKRWALLALDLATTDKTFWDLHCKLSLEHLRKELSYDVIQRKLPDFAKDSFSPLALICAVTEGREQYVSEQISDFIDFEVMKLLRESISDTNFDTIAAAERNIAWRQSERENRKEQKALASLFGHSVAQRLIEEFLFPIPENIMHQ